MKVYIRDLSRDIDYELELPIDVEDFLEQYNIEEYIIVDGDFNFSEYESLDSINEFAEVVDNNGVNYETAVAIFNNYSDIQEAIDTITNGNYMVYSDCSDMTDVAYQYIDETGGIENLDRETLEEYFDYEAYGRNMELGDTTFIKTDDGYVEIY